MRTTIFRRMLFVVSFVLCSTAYAQEEKEFNVDSTLYSYFQYCQENVSNLKVLHMADTLYQMSEERGDLRMQAVALALKLDYYYFQGNNVDKYPSLYEYSEGFC